MLVKRTSGNGRKRVKGRERQALKREKDERRGKKRKMKSEPIVCKKKVFFQTAFP